MFWTGNPTPQGPRDWQLEACLVGDGTPKHSGPALLVRDIIWSLASAISHDVVRPSVAGRVEKAGQLVGSSRQLENVSVVGKPGVLLSLDLEALDFLLLELESLTDRLCIARCDC